MSADERPIIAGAGPVGLGTALFLALEGCPVRLVEARTEPTWESKALAINPRTLEILESSGLTDRILELGMKVRGACFHRAGKGVAKLSFVGLHPKYPFMIALSQAATERLLARRLEAAGGMVERGVRMVACRNADDGVNVVLERSESGARESASGPWLLAADGAHSTARKELGIEFAGKSLASEWHLADVPLRTALASDHAHVFFDGGGFLFLIRVIDDALPDGPDPLWRVIGNRPEPLSRLLEAEVTGPPIWASSFRVAHRINKTMALGRVFFAGDAAHVHSPVGARGMNLGLEDAWVFAQLAKSARLDRYDALRRPLDRGVVRRIELLSRVASGDAYLARVARSVILPKAIAIPFTRKLMIRTVTGLDHPLPSELAAIMQHTNPTRQRGAP